ncbi:MAG: hypothetical protein WCR54_02110 [Clostridia bacterium]
MGKNKKNKNETNTPNKAKFELVRPTVPVDKEPTGERDYFAEFYNAYKNDYVKQYLDEYHKMKAQEEYDNKRK